MSKRLASLLIEDMIESGGRILAYTQGISFETFMSDQKTKDAVVRNFEVLGEAANRLPDPFKKQHHTIDWQRLRGFRNRIIHDYFGIDYLIVWEIIQSYLPQVIESLKETRGRIDV